MFQPSQRWIRTDTLANVDKNMAESTLDNNFDYEQQVNRYNKGLRKKHHWADAKVFEHIQAPDNFGEMAEEELWKVIFITYNSRNTDLSSYQIKVLSGSKVIIKRRYIPDGWEQPKTEGTDGSWKPSGSSSKSWRHGWG